MSFAEGESNALAEEENGSGDEESAPSLRRVAPSQLSRGAADNPYLHVCLQNRSYYYCLPIQIKTEPLIVRAPTTWHGVLRSADIINRPIIRAPPCYFPDWKGTAMLYVEIENM